MSFRTALTLAALALSGLLLAGQVRQLLADPTVWPPDDFVEYWAAAKLTLNGQNPFDPELLLPLQRHAGRDTDDAIMMWNPPWALPAVLPLGVIPAREAQLLWLLVHLLAIGYSADRLWLMLGGARESRWAGWTVGFLFLPTVFVLSSGQISAFLLLGAVLFLECERRNWQYLAGAATVLVAIKPHLAYLLWAGLALDALARGRWRVLVGGALTGVACAALPMIWNPQVWHQYADAMGNRPPAQWLSPTLGTVLRLGFGFEHFRLQFVSVALGAVWFAWYYRAHRKQWDWTEQLPIVLAVAFLTAPYGAWPFDMVLLLPAVVKLLLRSLADLSAKPGWAPGAPRFTLAGLAAVNLAMLKLNLFQIGSFWFLWVSPAVVLLYALHMRYEHVRADAPAPAAVPA
jgi:Glycosyltransferase family 87